MSSKQDTLAARTAAALAVFAVLAVIAWTFSGRPDAVFEARFAEEFRLHHQMFDSTRRQWAHRLFVLAILFTILAAPRLRFDSLASLLRPIHESVRRGYGALILAGVVIWATLRTLPLSSFNSFPDSSFAQFFIPSKQAYLWMAAAGLAIYATLAFAVHWLERAAWRRTLWWLVVLYVAVMSLPGLLTQLPLRQVGWQMMMWFDYHYSAVMGDAMRLVEGQIPLVDFKIFYGILRQALIAAWIKLAGPLDWGDYFRIVQWAQLVHVALVAWAFYLWRPKQPWLALFAVLLVLPWVHPLHVAIGFPNHSAMRHLGLPLAALVLLCARGWTVTAAAWWLGATAAILMLFNPETGIAVTFGFVVFELHRTPSLSIRTLLSLLWRFAGGAGAAAACFLLLLLVLVGRLPELELWQKLIAFLVDSATGFAGRKWTFTPGFALIGAHALWLSLRLAIRRGSRVSGPEVAFLAAMAAITFAWLAYYINAPDLWNLASSWFPYSFLAASALLNRHALVLTVRSWNISGDQLAKMLLGLRPLAFAVVVAPAMLAGNWNLLSFIPTHLQNVRGPEARAARYVSGVPMRASNAEIIERKAGAIRALSSQSGGKLIYLSSNAFTMPLLTGRPTGVWARDPFSETHRPGDFLRLVEQIRNASPLVVVFDDTADLSLQFPDQQKRFIAHIQRELSSLYRFAGKRDFLEIWMLRSWSPGTVGEAMR